MGRVLTNSTSLQVALETSIAVLPGSPLWKLLEPNAINAYGATITTVARQPISKNRQRRKGTTTDLDSAVEYEADWTLDSFFDFAIGFMFALPQLPNKLVRLQAGATAQSLAAVAATPAYTHSTIGAALLANTLLFARGFGIAGNNGLKVVIGGGSATETRIASALTNETPAVTTGATLETAGHRFADLTWTDATKTIGSAGKDMTTLGLSVGQFVRVGGATASEQFPTGMVYGRIVSIAAAAIVLDKVTNIGSGTLLGGGNQAADGVDLLYGQFIKNVAVDDASFVTRSFQFENAFPNLGPALETMYEYAKGNYCNQLTFNLPLSDKATITFAFIGTDTAVPSTTRAAEGANAQQPVQTTALNTSADIARLRVTQVDEDGITTDFKNLSLTLNNNVSPEKVLGLLGARYMNYGNFDVDLEAEIIFTSGAVVDAVRNNETVTMEFGVKNDDGGIFIDIPSLTLGGGAKSFPVNESVLVQLTGQAFRHATLGYSLSASVFPYLP